MKYIVLFFVFICVAQASAQKLTFDESQTEIHTDYSMERNWAALPWTKDAADTVPGSEYQDLQSSAEVDVFFIHPTTYTKRRSYHYLNAELDDNNINQKTDAGSIRYQASVFNGAARVFAPRYRQAHIRAYSAKDTLSNRKSFDLAYQDVKDAFTYYLENFNDGRPIIIAGHSQGTQHAGRLLLEFFDGKKLADQLVAAYLVGMPVRKNYFNDIMVCEDADDKGCFVSWRTFHEGYVPKYIQLEKSEVHVTNPLSWKTDTIFVPMSENLGSVYYNYEVVVAEAVQAQVHGHVLWVNKPKFKGSIFMRTKNYHIADYNLFYGNIRTNVSNRVEQYLKEKRAH